MKVVKRGSIRSDGKERSLRKREWEKSNQAVCNLLSPSPEEYRMSGDGHEFIVVPKNRVANRFQFE